MTLLDSEQACYRHEQERWENEALLEREYEAYWENQEWLIEKQQQGARTVDEILEHETKVLNDLGADILRMEHTGEHQKNPVLYAEKLFREQDQIGVVRRWREKLFEIEK